MSQQPLFLRFGKLLLGIAVIVLFSTVLLPTLTRSCDKLAQLSAMLEEKEIDPSRYYYSDVDKVGDASQELSNTMRFMPMGPEPAPAGQDK